jgi:hypothetical protein
LIANVLRWVQLRPGLHEQNETDAALAAVVAPWDSYVVRDVQSIGTPGATADPVTGEAVRVRGMESGYQEGSVEGLDVTLRFLFGNDQIKFINLVRFGRLVNNHWHPITAGGDSGALVWDQASLTVVGLHFGVTLKYSYAIKINRTLDLLGEAATGIDGGGSPVVFPSATIDLF